MKGLTSNSLKIIAIITMIIDHIGYYFYYNIPGSIYIVLRSIGRISMPIFVFLLIQGYFKTSNVKRYIMRLVILAVITQVLITLIGMGNLAYFEGYVTDVYAQLNIVFSFSLSLILLCMIDKRINIIKCIKNKILDIIIRVVVILLILAIYYFVPIDYGFTIPAIAIGLYVCENLNIKKKYDFKIWYMICISLAIIIPVIFQGVIGIFGVFSLVFIYLYNSKLGKKSKIIRNIFYMSFPIQHILLYILALIFN